MKLFDMPIKIGENVKEELAVSERCLTELRKIRKKLEHRIGGHSEFFDLGINLGLQSEKTIERKLEKIVRTCIWHSIALKIEFHVKLLYTIDGYLSAVENKNPISIFLHARYLLELVATVSAIDFDLEECLKIDSEDWEQRSYEFLGLLYRARYSTSDHKLEAIFAEHGIPKSLVRPIRMKRAIRQLTARHGFQAAPSVYATFSNICHHNGSGHHMLGESFRETNAIVARHGRAVFLNEKAAAVTVRYPALDSASAALAKTARVAWWSSHCADEIILDIAETPFSEKEISQLTKGRLKKVQPGDVPGKSHKQLRRQKPGRNDPCICGSGKKYKNCCWNKSKEGGLTNLL